MSSKNAIIYLGGSCVRRTPSPFFITQNAARSLTTVSDMKRLLVLSLSLFLMMGCSASNTQPETAANMQIQPALSPHPDNNPGNDADTLWGESVPDPYRWLENAEDQRVKTWAAAQDKRARDYINQLPSRKKFADRLSELLYVPNITTPEIAGQFAFYFARDAKAEKSILYIKGVDESNDKARVLLDPNTLSEDGSISIGEVFPSPDGTKLAYTLKRNNADTSTLYVMDTATLQNTGDVIEGARYAEPAWLPDGSGFYYTYFPTDTSIPVDKRPGETDVRFHKLGTAAASDPVLIEPLHDATKFHGVTLSKDGKWLTYQIQDGWNGNSLAVKRADAKDWVSLNAVKDTTYVPLIHRDAMYLLTNADAPHFRIEKIDLSADTPVIEPSAWKTLIPESQDRVIEDFAVIQDKLFVKTLKDVAEFLDVYDLDGTHIKSIELPDKGMIGTLSGHGEDTALYFLFSSYRTPKNIYRVDVASLDTTLWMDVKTPANTDDVIVEQLFATSKDGTKVPMYVLRSKKTPLDGTAKTIVYGYGGFLYAVTPFFNPHAYAWLEQGGIYVWSNLRGGSEYGEAWHKAGSRLNKQNVFDDYYAVAETLIEKKYTSREHLAAYGGSNGGLLVGAALTQRPDLYGAVVCAVPLLDMIRYHLFGSGRTWISEYSSVEESELSYRTIRAYSPYANVKPGTKYPPVLFLGADSDDRVDPMHARKMTAAIQDATSSDAPVLLRIEKNSGHGGADMTNQRIAQFADMFAFLDAVL